jgi:hypothetical protein
MVLRVSMIASSYASLCVWVVTPRYYVSTNILLPITEPLALSFAEMVGPKQTKYFVSDPAATRHAARDTDWVLDMFFGYTAGCCIQGHYWGTPFEHAMHSVVKHAQLAEGRRWKHAPYWQLRLSSVGPIGMTIRTDPNPFSRLVASTVWYVL